MNPIEQFQNDCAAEIALQGTDKLLLGLSTDWMNRANRLKYSYHFEWLGRPIIQYPQDIVAIQELIWKIQPDVVVETGIAHGGSLILSASILELVAACGGPSNAKVIGVDVDIRAHNRAAITERPMSRRIEMIEGSSVDPTVVDAVRRHIKPGDRVLVFLDSNHTHDHVLEELRLYSTMVTEESFCVVFDTVIDDMPEDMFEDRPWSVGNSPKSAVAAFLSENSLFEIDTYYDNKLMVTVAPGGFLRRKQG